MKIFYFMGHNPQNQSGVSWKMWKIERKDQEVTVWWGSATIAQRRPRPAHTLQSKTWRLRTPALAKVEEERRIEEKLRKGYKRVPNRKPARPR